ncbi:hypothetical protein [Alteromonas sp. ASW11-130]|uniref:hypothetical protein n=1 Tax=Alteromonas sp. ASW11-130 TaxID=3015775 RepID=UPI002241BF1E|nr:hypothetical protein [Alteromonas sp. ASW11-130]MCW8092956.1 hypothetical protein [Alteromonas sp. ASW11-130]
METINVSEVQELNASELDAITGAGLFYDLGRFFAEVANANDSIYRQYGNTNMNYRLP